VLSKTIVPHHKMPTDVLASIKSAVTAEYHAIQSTQQFFNVVIGISVKALASVIGRVKNNLIFYRAKLWIVAKNKLFKISGVFRWHYCVQTR